MIVLKLLAAAAILAGATAAAYTTAFIPYQQEIRKKKIAADLRVIFDRSGGGQPAFADVIIVRENIAFLQNALRYEPTDARLHLQLAGSYILMGRYDDAIAQCRTALRHHQRPEIYFRLGDAQIASGKVDEAMTSYAHVAAFYPPDFALLPEVLRKDIRQRVQSLYGDDVAAQLPAEP
jgi:tetratricopeptide (TPR) repeat protein